MKLRIILSGRGGELDRQTIEIDNTDGLADGRYIIEALKCWCLAPGDTIKIEEME